MATQQEPIVRLSGASGAIKYGYVIVYRFNEWDISRTGRGEDATFEAVCRDMRVENPMFVGRDTYTLVCNLRTNAWVWTDCTVEESGKVLNVRGNGAPQVGQPLV